MIAVDDRRELETIVRDILKNEHNVDYINLVERITRVEESVKLVHDEIKMLIHQMDKRFEQVDKRLEQVDKRFEQMDKRFTQLQWLIGLGFTFMTVLIIVFKFLAN